MRERVNKEIRTLKVYGRSQNWWKGITTKYKEVPAIILSGDWLAAKGFNVADVVKVEVSDNKLVIIKE